MHTVTLKNFLKEMILMTQQEVIAINFNYDESSTSMYEGGFVFFCYLARQASDFTIENRTAKTTIQTFYGNDTITNFVRK